MLALIMGHVNILYAAKKPGAGPGFLEYPKVLRRSGSFQVAGRQFATLGDNLVADALAFGQ